MGNLDCSDAYTARAGVDQYSFAALQFGAVGKGKDRRCKYEREARNNLSDWMLAVITMLEMEGVGM